MSNRITHTPTPVVSHTQGDVRFKLCPKCGLKSDWLRGQVCDGRDIRLRIPHVDQLIEDRFQPASVGANVELTPVE